MAVRLVTFGGLHVVGDSGELNRLLTQHSRAALFVYLAVERRVSREALTAVFWPESDAENARHALRQSLYQLRKAIGDAWIDSRAHELVVRDMIRADAHDFTGALARADVATAVQLYRGPFLDGVHLVDLKPWESWVDSRRAQFARAFRKACRDLLDAKRASGDLAGAVETAERWTALDTSDDEAQHRLIEALAAAGERAEAIRQYETYVRILEPEGLQPLDETSDLVERLRSDSTPLPALRAGTIPATEAAPPLPATSLVPPDAAGEPTAPRRPRRPLWRRPRLAVAAVAIAVLAATWGGWRVTRDAPPTPPAPTAIAVLPLASVGADTADTYFADGMTEALITALAHVPGLRVTPRTSAFALKGHSLNARQVGETLHVASVLEGSVQRAGERLRFVVRLTDARVDRAMWAATYEGDRRDVFRLQDSIARAVVSALRLRLERGRAGSLVRQATRSPAAHELYLQGRHFWNQRTPNAIRTAARYLERAIALDSSYAEAYAALADTYALFAIYEVSPPREAYPRASAAALRALTLDSTLAEAHATLGYGKMRYEWDWAGAEREFQRAMALDPSYATAHFWYALLLSARGRHAGALAEIDRALALDPLSRVISAARGEVLLWSGRHDEAIAQLRRVLELDPDFALARQWLGRAYLMKGMRAEAVGELETAARLSTQGTIWGLLAYAHAATGQPHRALAIVREHSARARHQYIAPTAFALAYAGLADTAQALAWLERAADGHDPYVPLLLGDPLFDIGRSDPRFTAVLERVGLR